MAPLTDVQRAEMFAELQRLSDQFESLICQQSGYPAGNFDDLYRAKKVGLSKKDNKAQNASRNARRSLLSGLDPAKNKSELKARLVALNQRKAADIVIKRERDAYWEAMEGNVPADNEVVQEFDRAKSMLENAIKIRTSSHTRQAQGATDPQAPPAQDLADLEATIAQEAADLKARQAQEAADLKARQARETADLEARLAQVASQRQAQVARDSDLPHEVFAMRTERQLGPIVRKRQVDNIEYDIELLTKRQSKLEKELTATDAMIAEKRRQLAEITGGDEKGKGRERIKEELEVETEMEMKIEKDVDMGIPMEVAGEAAEGEKKRRRRG